MGGGLPSLDGGNAGHDPQRLLRPLLQGHGKEAAQHHQAQQGEHDRVQNPSLSGREEAHGEYAAGHPQLAERYPRRAHLQRPPLPRLVSAQHQQPAVRHAQPCSSLLQPAIQPHEQGRQDGQQEDRGDEVLDQGGIQGFLPRDHGQGRVLPAVRAAVLAGNPQRRGAGLMPQDFDSSATACPSPRPTCA